MKHLVNIIQFKLYMKLYKVPNSIFILNKILLKFFLFYDHVLDNLHSLYNKNIANNDFKALIASVFYTMQ